MAEPQLNGPTSGVSGGGGDDPNKDNDGHDDFNKQQMKTPPSKKAPRKRQEGESDEASDASTAMTSTALTPMTVGSLASTQHPMMELERRDQLHQQMILLSLTTMATFAFFVTTIVPFTILVAFGLFGTSAGLLSYAGYQRLLIELQELAAGDGFAQLLPMGLVQTLTQTSIHEFMRDDTFFREWGFLAIYFIPGLTEDQLNDYIRRLAPDRNVLLNRRGMGYMLGDRFMRALVGDRRWQHDAIAGEVPAIEPLNEAEEAVDATRSRGLDLNSDNESQVSASPLGLTVPGMEAHNNENGNAPSDDERRRQLTAEGDVIVAAFWDGMWNYFNAGVGAAAQLAYNQVLQPAGGIATTVGLMGSVSLTVLSMGVGLWQYNRPTSPSSGRQPARAFSGYLLSTTLIGGLSTGVMLYARSAIRKPSKPPAPGPSTKPPPKK